MRLQSYLFHHPEFEQVGYSILGLSGDLDLGFRVIFFPLVSSSDRTVIQWRVPFLSSFPLRQKSFAGEECEKLN